ncbi:MAG: hypothetical protein V1846_01145 [Candidatus Komeilibacteria bacterium]
MKWLEGILAAVATTDIEAVTIEVRPHEQVIGTVPEELQRFMSLIMKRNKEAEVKFRQHLAERLLDQDHNKATCQCQKYAEEMQVLMDDLKLLNKLFWRELREAAGVPHANLGWRQDWAIVTWKTEDVPPDQQLNDVSQEIGELLGRLGGIIV